MCVCVCASPGGNSERGLVRSLRGGLLHLPLAPGPRRGAVRTQGVVQHRGGPAGPCAHAGWRDPGLTLRHATGKERAEGRGRVLVNAVTATSRPPQGKNPVAKDGKACAVAAGAAAADQPLLSVDQEEYYIPSVDLLTAQVTDSSCGTDQTLQ